MNWQTVKLGEVCKIVSGSTPKTGTPEYWNGDILWATPRDLSRLNQMYLSDTEKKITAAGLKSCSAQMLPVGSVLFSSRAPIGHVAVNTKPVCTNQGFKSFVPDEARLNNRFLFYWLDVNRKYLQSLGNGATFKEVSKAIISQVEIPLPPLAEQERIAARLDAADRLRALRRDALARLDALTHSLFLEMFGDPAHNPMDWPLVKISDVITRKPNNGIFRKNPDYGEGLPVAWVGELFKGSSIDLSESRQITPTSAELDKFSLKHGDILFCRSSLKLDGIGYNNVYLGEDDEALFECHVIRISPDQSQINSQFFNSLLRMKSQREKLFRQAKTVTMTTIDQQGLLRIEIPLPPLSLQQSFARRLGQIERVRAGMERSRLELDALLASLQSAAFEGNNAI